MQEILSQLNKEIEGLKKSRTLQIRTNYHLTPERRN